MDRMRCEADPISSLSVVYSTTGKPPVPHCRSQKTALLLATSSFTKMNNRSRNPQSLGAGKEPLQPSLNGKTQEAAYEKCGTIWIKLPAGTRGSSLRPWSKKYTSVRSELFLQPDAVHLCALLLIQRSEKPDSEIVFKKRLTSQNTIIFRSK